MATDGKNRMPDIILRNMIYNESEVTSATHPDEYMSAWTKNISLPRDQSRKNTSKSEGAECACPLMSVEHTGRILSVAMDALNSQSLTGHTAKALLTYLA